MKSLQFFKPALAITLAIVLGWLLSVRPAEAGYSVTLQQVGPDVVATGSGPIDLTGLIHAGYLTRGFGPGVLPGAADDGWGGAIAGFISTGPTIAGSTDSYHLGPGGPTSFGSGGRTAASSGSGDTVGTAADCSKSGSDCDRFLIVPRGYISGTFLSNSATYSGKTFATLGVTPGTYVSTWGSGADQNFTLQIKTPGPARTAIWYLNNNAFVAGAGAPTLPAGWIVVGVADFNGDSQPDYLLYNTGTQQTGVWYLNNNVYVGGAFGPTLPVGWKVVGVADFDGDGRPDYLLFNSTTRETAIWYLSGTTFVRGAFGPSLSPPDGSVWDLVAVGDFNADGKPDYVIYNIFTHQTAIWYLNNNVFVGGILSPTLPVNWRVVGVADFNGDNKPDYLLFNSSTRQTAIWYLSGPTLLGGAFGPSIASGYTLIGAADFNANGKPDYVLYGASVH